MWLIRFFFEALFVVLISFGLISALMFSIYIVMMDEEEGDDDE